MAKSVTKISAWEKLWIVIASLFAVAGLTFIVFGIIGSHWAVSYSDNWILTSEVAFTAKIHLSYRWFGTILLLAGAIISVISLNFFEKKSDADQERAERRAQRMKIIQESSTPTENQTEGAQEVASTPAEEPTPAE